MYDKEKDTARNPEFRDWTSDMQAQMVEDESAKTEARLRPTNRSSKTMSETTQNDPNWQPVFSPWRHGGWYVDNLQYPSGAVGCVSRNYPLSLRNSLDGSSSPCAFTLGLNLRSGE